MSLASVLLLPLAILSPVTALHAPEGSVERAQETGLSPLWFNNGNASLFKRASHKLQPIPQSVGDAWQMRIEQRIIIRIEPRGPNRVPPDMFVAMPERGRRVRERPFGNCIPAAAIAGVQPERGSRLLLFLRDRRVLSAELERSCRAMDFYSGFYISRSRDGKVCVNRDKLLARSGMKCRLTRFSQLVEAP